MAQLKLAYSRGGGSTGTSKRGGMPKRPKLKKIPATPKSSNPDVLERHLKRVKAIRKENHDKLRKWEADKNKIRKLKEQIRAEGRSKL